MLTILNPTDRKADYTICFTDENHAYDILFPNVASSEDLKAIWEKYREAKGLPETTDAYAIQKETGESPFQVIPDRRTPVEHNLEYRTLQLI